jgi:hypothetical protein
MFLTSAMVSVDVPDADDELFAGVAGAVGEADFVSGNDALLDIPVVTVGAIVDDLHIDHDRSVSVTDDIEPSAGLVAIGIEDADGILKLGMYVECRDCSQKGRNSKSSSHEWLPLSLR